MSPTSFARTFRGPLAIVAWLISIALPVSSPAQNLDALAQGKIARDLVSAVTTSSGASLPWANLLNGQLMVRVIVSANSDDALLKDLRQFVLSSAAPSST